MLVKLQDSYKDLYTLNDLERARAIIRMMREDESVVAEYAEMLRMYEAWLEETENPEEAAEIRAETEELRDYLEAYKKEALVYQPMKVEKGSVKTKCGGHH